MNTKLYSVSIVLVSTLLLVSCGGEIVTHPQESEIAAVNESSTVDSTDEGRGEVAELQDAEIQVAKTKDYRPLIAEQFKKGDNFARKNASALALNTRQYVWPKNRSKSDPHDCYIISRAYHDHMKFPYKGYAPNKRNYMGYYK